MNEEKETAKAESRKIEIKDFADEQKPEEQIDLSEQEHTLDDETIDEAIADENADESTDSEAETEKENLESDSENQENNTDYSENGVKSEEVKSSNGVESSEKEQVADLEDKDVEDAVDDIVREESDDVLVLDDAIKEPEEPEQKGLKAFAHKIKSGFMWWWTHTLIRNVSLALLFVSLIAVGLVPVTRYAVLNALGVRVESSLQVVDQETSLPLQNIRVSMQNNELVTDENGEVTFPELKLGNTELVLARRGYAESRESIVLGLGSNPLGEKSIVATGVQYSFELRDWISDAVVDEAVATAGEYNARVDEGGKVTITLGEDSEEDVDITIQAEGYRDQTYTATDLNASGTNPAYLVNDRKHLFVSNRDNQYDIFTVDLDGKNEEVLLEATGKERDIPQLFAHPAQQKWAIISSHEGETNKDDYVLDGLYIVDTPTSDITRIARSERIQVVGWSADYIVYWQIVEGTSQGNPERSKLYTYNFITGERIELAAANYFNDVELVDDTIYYAVSGFAVPESYARLFSVNVNGEQQVQVLNKQVYSIFRVGVNELLYSAANQEWFEHDLANDIEETERRITVPNNYNYVYSPSGESYSWVRVRDGQGVLQYATLAEEEVKEKEAAVDAGIREPLYWLGDGAILYRVVKSGETADYLVSLKDRPNGQEKITKITNITVRSFNDFR